MRPCWHWYFEDAVPDSAYPVELNEDGLWDIRIIMSDGRVESFLQEESFTLFANNRNDWIALNGTSSPPIDSEHKMWKCFDGDKKTAYSSSLKLHGKVSLQIHAPFGVKSGNISIQTLDQYCPKECVLFAGDEEIKRFILENESGKQRIHIGDSIKKAGSVQLVIESAYGDNDRISIAELTFE
jgi:hypothetical protein